MPLIVALITALVALNPAEIIFLLILTAYCIVLKVFALGQSG
jgi:hypothetical protein